MYLELNMDLTDEQFALKDAAHRFSKEVMRPASLELDPLSMAILLEEMAIAIHYNLFCTVDASQGMKGGGICLVPLDLPGVSRGKPLKKLGSRDLNQGEIFFQDVRVPKEYMVCEP